MKNGWSKRWTTRDDFAADTGFVVRDTLSPDGQALYDAARAKAVELLTEVEGRDITVSITASPAGDALIRLTRGDATRAFAKATVTTSEVG